MRRLGLFIATALVALPACKSEVDTCREQLTVVLQDFYKGDQTSLQIEHWASFDRLPQHNAPSCVTDVLHDEGVDPLQAAAFETLAPLWRAATADTMASSEPEVDADGLIRASPSGDFYSKACARNFDAACARKDLADDVLDCSRAKSAACVSAAEALEKEVVFAQAFASPVTLWAKACISGSRMGCDKLNGRSDLPTLDADFAAKVCDAMPGEEVCRRGLESKSRAELARTKLCDPLKVSEFCPAEAEAEAPAG